MRRQAKDGNSGIDRRWRLPTLMLGLCALVVCVAGRSSLAQGNSGITVRDRTLLKDGQVWVPKGFTLISFVAPEAVLLPAYKGARSSYGAAVLDRAKALGADVLRFQVSQVGLDPQSSVYDPKYLEEVTRAVKQARDKGFSVIVSMQWEPPSGLKGQPMMPSDITSRAWSKILPAFAGDKYVMLEVFNEPGMWESTPSAWPTWKSGMQGLVDQLRSGGAQNTLLLDGLRGAHYLNGAPAISDPQHKIAYAIHPYLDDKDHGPADWTRDFGNFAHDHPVLVTEWNATSTLQCRPDEPQISREFVDYLKEKNIGLVLWALDLHGTLFDGNDNPIGFKDFQCGKAGYGAAWIAIQYFHSDAAGAKP